MCRAADFLQIGGVILGLENVRADVVADAVGALGVLDIELQMRRVVVVAAVDRGRVRAEGLVDHRLHAMGGDDGAFGLLLDHRGRHDLFGDHNQATGGLGLLLVLPARAVDPAIALRVCDLHMHEGDVGRERASSPHTSRP